MMQLGMDRKIEKKKWTQTKILYIVGAFAFVILAFFGFKAINKKIYLRIKYKI